MKQLTQKKAYIILTLIILSALMLYTYFFFEKKKGYDSDEVYSYSLANSYFKPFLEEGDNWNMNYVSEVIPYLETWINGSVLHDYITVQNGEQFSYDSVWYNQSKDVHPPFYYAVLHTICSFFPDIYSPWFALSINYISFIFVMILLFKIGTRYGSYIFSLLLCSFYAFSAGAVDTYTFLRMYALCALLALLMFTAMSGYINSHSRKYLASLFIITLISSLTHYYLVLFAFFLTLITEVYFLLKRRWKYFFSLGFTMLLGVLSALIIFPASINHLFSKGTGFAGQSMSPYYQTRYIIRLIIQQFTGITLPYLRTYFPIYATTVVGIVSVLLLLSFFLFRKENWAEKFFKGTKRILLALLNKIKKIISNLPCTCHILSITLLCLFIYDIYCLPIATMQDNTIRYLFPFYPLLCCFIFWILKEAIPLFIKKNLKFFISIFVLIICSINSVLLNPHCFLSDNIELQGKQIKNLENEASYIIFVPKSYHIANFSILLQDVSNIYFLSIDENMENPLPDTLMTLPTDATNHPIYLLIVNTETNNINYINERSETEWISLISVLPYVEKNTFIGEDCTNGYLYDIYQLH